MNSRPDVLRKNPLKRVESSRIYFGRLSRRMSAAGSRAKRATLAVLPPAVFAAALAAYLQTLAPSLVKGDGGEFQLVMPTLGVPHPTGYPLYTLLGWLWIKIVPLGSVAWRENLLSAVCGALAATLVYGIVHRLTRRVLPALAAAAFFALSPTFWSLSSVTEVYALNALFAALLLYLLLAWRDAGARRFPLLVSIAFVFGLSLSHHRTILLFAPGMALFVLLESRARGWLHGLAPGRIVRRGLALGLAFAAGLLPYLHVFIHQVSRGATFWQVLTGEVLGGDYAFFLGLRSDVGQVLWGIPHRELGLAGLILAAVGLSWLAWKERRVALLLAVSLIIVFGFCLFYRVPDVGDFLPPATLILSICAGASAAYLGGLAQRTAAEGAPVWKAHGRWLRPVLEVVLLGVALSLVRNVGPVRANVVQRIGDVEPRARELVAYPFVSGSTVLADWELATASNYLIQVEGVKTEAQVIPIKLTTQQACVDLLSSMDRGRIVYIAPPVQITRLPDGYQMTSEPPYLTIERATLAYRSVNRPVAPGLVLQGFQRDGTLLVLRWLVEDAPLAGDYTTYVHFFDAQGQAIGQQDKGLGEVTCWYPPSAWPVGQVMQDAFVIPLETARIRLGMYGWNGGQIEQYGEQVMLDLPLTLSLFHDFAGGVPSTEQARVR